MTRKLKQEDEGVVLTKPNSNISSTIKVSFMGMPQPIRIRPEDITWSRRYKKLVMIKVGDMRYDFEMATEEMAVSVIEMIRDLSKEFN